MLLIFDLDDTLFPRLRDDYTEMELNSIKLYPGARELLQRDGITKVLITKGEESFQNKKIDLLNIRNLFNLILICSTDEEKKDCFEDVLNRFPQESDVWVIGDRADSEIRWGNELGLKTIWFRQGKYRNLQSTTQPDKEVKSFQELKKALK